MLDSLATEPSMTEALGRNGREYVTRQYGWSVIERKYFEMFDRLKTAAAPRMEPPPGWFARRRPVVPAAAELLARVPAGPVMHDDSTVVGL